MQLIRVGVINGSRYEQKLYVEYNHPALGGPGSE